MADATAVSETDELDHQDHNHNRNTTELTFKSLLEAGASVESVESILLLLDRASSLLPTEAGPDGGLAAAYVRVDVVLLSIAYCLSNDSSSWKKCTFISQAKWEEETAKCVLSACMTSSS